MLHVVQIRSSACYMQPRLGALHVAQIGSPACSPDWEPCMQHEGQIGSPSLCMQPRLGDWEPWMQHVAQIGSPSLCIQPRLGDWEPCMLHIAQLGSPACCMQLRLLFVKALSTIILRLNACSSTIMWQIQCTNQCSTFLIIASFHGQSPSTQVK